jgi:hypothetical protein
MTDMSAFAIRNWQLVTGKWEFVLRLIPRAALLQ